MKFIVDRATWYRGKGAPDSRLLRKDGMRCCIGHVAAQCKVPDSAIFDLEEVERLISDERLKFPKWMQEKPDANANIGHAYEINDSASLSDQEREDQLTALFAERGDELEFAG